MSDSVFDVNEIAKVLRGSMNETPWAKEGAAAIVAWLDERIFAREYRGDGSINAVIVQPEDQQ